LPILTLQGHCLSRTIQDASRAPETSRTVRDRLRDSGIKPSGPQQADSGIAPDKQRVGNPIAPVSGGFAYPGIAGAQAPSSAPTIATPRHRGRSSSGHTLEILRPAGRRKRIKGSEGSSRHANQTALGPTDRHPPLPTAFGEGCGRGAAGASRGGGGGAGLNRAHSSKHGPILQQIGTLPSTGGLVCPAPPRTGNLLQAAERQRRREAKRRESERESDRGSGRRAADRP
jgi:hypothetical protein